MAEHWSEMISYDFLIHTEHVCCLSVPPLEGFVMNRVQGDYFETLLYKIFVSIDEQTNVAEVGLKMFDCPLVWWLNVIWLLVYWSTLQPCPVCFFFLSLCGSQLANVLEIDLDLVKVSIYLLHSCCCRCVKWNKVIENEGILCSLAGRYMYVNMIWYSEHTHTHTDAVLQIPSIMLHDSLSAQQHHSHWTGAWIWPSFPQFPIHSLSDMEPNSLSVLWPPLWRAELPCPFCLISFLLLKSST